jgi:hypothetical protein
MKTTTTASIGRIIGVNLKPCTAIAGVLLGALASGCLDGQTTAGSDGGASAARDAARGKPDARAAAGAGGQSMSADGGLEAPLPNPTCTVGTQCASGFCVDGVCCDAACNGPCQSCSLAGNVGICSSVKNAQDDTCNGESTCSGSGTCLKALGKTCDASSACASGNCADGVCCASATCGTCQSCSIAGSAGVCAPVPMGQQDADCSLTRACDGLGQCRGGLSVDCYADKDCASGHCVDRVCCNQACTGTCYGCNNSEDSSGLCRPILGAPDLIAASPCTLNNVCDIANGSPFCKTLLGTGQPCTFDWECVSRRCRWWYPDDDGDGFGTNDGASLRCGTASQGYSDNFYDCCDADASTYLGETAFSTTPDACGRSDRNCDGIIEAAVPPATGWR